MFGSSLKSLHFHVVYLGMPKPPPQWWQMKVCWNTLPKRNLLVAAVTGSGQRFTFEQKCNWFTVPCCSALQAASIKKFALGAQPSFVVSVTGPKQRSRDFSDMCQAVKTSLYRMIISPLIGNPYNWLINHHYYIDDHPLPQGRFMGV